MWDGTLFRKTSLSDLGLVIQLGHVDGESCACPEPAPANFMVLDTNGWHPVTLAYCKCDNRGRAGTRVQQLLRYELYPATLGEPSTCATLRLLDTYHALTLQSKITVYDYYVSLKNMTDATGISVTWVCASGERLFRAFGSQDIAGSAEATAAHGAPVAAPQSPEARG